MVLTNTLIAGLTLLALVCNSSGISEVQKRQSRLPETTTISAKGAAEIENSISRTQKLSTISSKPKTDILNSKHIEQIKSRGSIKYSGYSYTTTESLTTSKRHEEDLKNSKLTTIRNDRSLSLNTDTYNPPEFHSENNIYSEAQVKEKRYGNINNDKFTTQKSWEHVNYEHVLTTPKNEIFDNKYRKVQEDITNAFNDALTTDKNENFGDKYQRLQDDTAKTPRIELTTPKDDMFDDRHRKVQEDLTKSLARVDEFFDEGNSKENIEKPHIGDSKLDYTRYRAIEAIESKIKNKVRKDYNTETGMRMKITSDYNNSQVIDAPGIVVNTIPTDKSSESGKQVDLDQGETTIERISIEKPEKDPISSINNQIENEMIKPLTTEGPEEKPFEHKSIYLSKRGSTTHSKHQTIEKSLSTESSIPLDLYPSRPDLIHTTLSLRIAENETFISKSITKDKVLNKTAEKDAAISEYDLDNKIPKFLPSTTAQNLPNETATASIVNHTIITTQEPTELFSETDNFSTLTHTFGSTPTTETYISDVTDIMENNSTTKIVNFDDASDVGVTLEFFEITHSTALDDLTTITTELLVTDEPYTNTKAVSEEEESITTESYIHNNIKNNSKNEEYMKPVTLKVTTNSKTWEYSDAENTVFAYNQSLNKIADETKQLNKTITSTETVEPFIASLINSTTNAGIGENLAFLNNTVFETNSTTRTGHVHDISAKKNETVLNIINEITKPTNFTNISIISSNIPSTESIKPSQVYSRTESAIHIEEEHIKENITKQADSDQAKQNEINGDKLVSDECENLEDNDDYGENNCKINNAEEGSDADTELEDNSHGANTQKDDTKYSPAEPTISIPANRHSTTNTADNINETTTPTAATKVPTTVITFRPVTHKTRQIDTTEADFETTARTESIIGSDDNDEDGGNAGKVAAIVISTIGGICLLLLVALLIIMKKRQKRFNYGQRCRPVSLDAYSMDNVSIHNSTRRKGVLMTSKRSYGNPAFEDPTSPSHVLNISDLLRFANNLDGTTNEFEKIPQVTTKTNELPEGCDVKNRYANVIPLPETRVFLSPIEGIPSSDYINANYVMGPQGSRHYYIACQAPMQNTIEDFWRMIWEQQSKVVLMITHLYEGGVEKCIDYLPPSEVLDCHRLFGDYQITLKKREAKDKYIISSLQLKNMVSNSWREITHLWYMGWPEKGVPEEANSLIAFLLEARSCMKTGENKVKETSNTNISNGLSPNTNPVVVHCSPGTGRTGTVLACDIAVREFELSRKVDIPRIVYRIRRDRASAVQTKEQYAFIYKVIHFYATKLTGGVFDSF